MATRQVPGRSKSRSLAEAAAQFGNILIGFVVVYDAVNARRRRALVRPDRERFDGVRLAAHERFDAAIMPVAYPAGKPQGVGLGVQRPAEADALHASVDEKTTGQQSHARQAMISVCRRRWRRRRPGCPEAVAR